LEQEIRDNHEFPLSNEAVMALLKRIEEGDQTALAALFDKTNRLLFGLVLRILGDRTAAEEALLDVYTCIWKQPASCDSRLLPMEWLTTIARDRAIARLHWSKQGKTRPSFKAASRESAMTIAPERQELARFSIGSLVPAQQEILEWVYYSGLSCTEIAVMIGRPLGAIKTHARLGLNKLTEMFRPVIEREMEARSATGESH
jgi:RNA polymerase sigma-70 factor (ECF subfamily)